MRESCCGGSDLLAAVDEVLLGSCMHKKASHMLCFCVFLKEARFGMRNCLVLDPFLKVAFGFWLDSETGVVNGKTRKIIA